MKVRDVIRYFSVSAVFLFGAISIIKYIKEDQFYINIMIGLAIGLIGLIASFFIKEDDEKKEGSS